MRSLRSNRMRRCCSPSSAPTRRRAGGPPSAARVGPTPRSSSAPGSSTIGSRPCRWSRTAASSSPRVTGSSVWASTQSVFGVQREIAGALGLDASQVSVRAPAVGGGFGAKGGVYVEQLLVAALAQRLGRPIAWCETRHENLLNMTHGRGQAHDVEIGARRDGTIVGLRVRGIANVGAYPIRGALRPDGHAVHGLGHLPRSRRSSSTRASCSRTRRRRVRTAGPDVPKRPRCWNARSTCSRTCWTSTWSTCAGATSSRPTRSRTRRATGATYDTGEYARALDEALARSDYDDWRAEQAARRGEW